MKLSAVYCFLTINTLIPWICATETYQVNFSEIRTVTSASISNNTGPDTSVVKLNNCGIRNIDKDSLKNIPKLKRLDVSRNELEYLVIGTFQYSLELTFLSLTHNYIKNLHKNIFQNLTKLSKLYLKENKISDIHPELLSNLVNLRELSISYNQLKLIDSKCFLKTTNLQKLWLEWNLLSILDNGSFSSLTKLEFLQLQHNLITDIGQYAFPSNSVLKQVYLEDNKLQYLHDETIEVLGNVTFLSLHKNSWFCDCRLMNLYNIWKNYFLSFIPPNAPKCAGPNNLQNISWEKLESSDLCDNMKTNNTTMDMDNENNEDKNKSEKDNDNIWKILCLASVTFLSLIIVFIIIIFSIVKKYKRNSPMYDIPKVILEMSRPESGCYDEVKSTPEIVPERNSCAYDELKLPENVIDLKAALYDKVKEHRRESVDEDGYLKPQFINK